MPETVVVIIQNDTDSMVGRSWFRAVAKDEAAAKQWIQDEVDHKHDNGNRYAQGQTADWWIQYRTFDLKTVTVH
jgi:hypothetical protein